MKRDINHLPSLSVCPRSVPSRRPAIAIFAAGCILSEAFIQPSPAGLVPAAAVAVPAKHSGSTALRVLRRPSGAQAAPAAGRSRKPGLRPSARGAGPAGVGGEEPRTGKAKQRGWEIGRCKLCMTDTSRRGKIVRTLFAHETLLSMSRIRPRRPKVTSMCSGTAVRL